MKKTLFTVLLALLFVGCSSSDDEEPANPTLNDLDLTKQSSIVGQWLLEEQSDSQPSKELLTVNADGTMTRSVSAYKFSGTYTYDNGTLTFTESSTTGPYEITYKFSHYNEYRLKVEKTASGLTTTFLAYDYGD